MKNTRKIKDNVDQRNTDIMINNKAKKKSAKLERKQKQAAKKFTIEAA